MQRFNFTLGTIVLMILICQQIVHTQNVVKVAEQDNLDRAVVFAVQQEVNSGDLRNRSDLCLGLGYGLAVDEKAVMLRLKRSGLKLHLASWCNDRLLGLMVTIVAPIKQTSTGDYILELPVGDLSPISKGEHFATLLRRGIYVVHCEKGSDPQLVSYRKVCCEEAH